MAFSNVLKQLREEKNLSQKDIANYLGLTRQAVTSYELAKREPDYSVLKKLADYFSVSIDYLLGRANCKDINAFTVGKNIELIRGDLTYKELSADISKKTGVLIFYEMLELYEKGERMPFIGTIKILAKYALVQDSFFRQYNTLESYNEERELYKREMKIVNTNENLDYRTAVIGDMESDLIRWIMTGSSNVNYIKFVKEIQESGLTVSEIRPIIENLKSNKKV